jgi:hypothetical protein
VFGGDSDDHGGEVSCIVPSGPSAEESELESEGKAPRVRLRAVAVLSPVRGKHNLACARARRLPGLWAGAAHGGFTGSQSALRLRFSHAGRSDWRSERPPTSSHQTSLVSRPKMSAIPAPASEMFVAVSPHSQQQLLWDCIASSLQGCVAARWAMTTTCSSCSGAKLRTRLPSADMDADCAAKIVTNSHTRTPGFTGFER